MKFNEIFQSVKLTETKQRGIPDGDAYEENKVERDLAKIGKAPNVAVTPANAKNMSKKDMEEYDLYLVVDKKNFGFNVGGTFLVTSLKFKPDGGLMVKVPKAQRASGEIFIPSNRSGTKFILSKGPDSGPSIPVDTHAAVTLINRGINEGKIGDKRITSRGSLWLEPSQMHSIRQHSEKTNAKLDKREVKGKEHFSNLKDWEGRVKAKGADTSFVNKKEGYRFHTARLNGKIVGIFNDKTKDGYLKENKSEWESRHGEFVKAGEEASSVDIKKIIDGLKQTSAKLGKKTGMFNKIFGSKSSGDNARSSHGAETLAKNIERLKNAKQGSEERKELGQQLVYARSLLKRTNESLKESQEITLPIFKKIDKATGPFGWGGWNQDKLDRSDAEGHGIMRDLPDDTPILLFDDAEGGYYCGTYVVAAPDCYYVGGIPDKKDDDLQKFKKTEEAKMIKFIEKCLENCQG